MKFFRNLCIALVIGIVGLHFYCVKSENFIRARVIKISAAGGMCSGEQIHTDSGNDYILTAAHCRMLGGPDGVFTITTEDGKTLRRKLIAEDPNSDLLLLEGVPGLRGLDIAVDSKQSEHIRTFTHGRNKPTYRTEGEIIDWERVKIPVFPVENDEDVAKCLSQPKYSVEDTQVFIFQVKMCVLSVDETATTAMIVPGSSGGPVVNSSGDLTGVVSAGDDKFGYLVQLSDIHRFVGAY